MVHLNTFHTSQPQQLGRLISVRLRFGRRLSGSPLHSGSEGVVIAVFPGLKQAEAWPDCSVEWTRPLHCPSHQDSWGPHGPPGCARGPDARSAGPALRTVSCLCSAQRGRGVLSPRWPGFLLSVPLGSEVMLCSILNTFQCRKLLEGSFLLPAAHSQEKSRKPSCKCVTRPHPPQHTGRPAPSPPVTAARAERGLCLLPGR